MRRIIMVLMIGLLVGTSMALAFYIPHSHAKQQPGTATQGDLPKAVAPPSKLPDLVVDRINIPICPREGKDCILYRSNVPKMKFEVTVKNIGGARAGASKLLVKIEVSDPTGRVIHSSYVESRIPDLVPGRTFISTFEIPTPPEGTCELRAIADYGVEGRGEVREEGFGRLSCRLK